MATFTASSVFSLVVINPVPATAATFVDFTVDFDNSLFSNGVGEFSYDESQLSRVGGESLGFEEFPNPVVSSGLLTVEYSMNIGNDTVAWTGADLRSYSPYFFPQASFEDGKLVGLFTDGTVIAKPLSNSTCDSLGITDGCSVQVVFGLSDSLKPQLIVYSLPFTESQSILTRSPVLYTERGCAAKTL